MLYEYGLLQVNYDFDQNLKFINVNQISSGSTFKSNTICMYIEREGVRRMGVVGVHGAR